MESATWKRYQRGAFGRIAVPYSAQDGLIVVLSSVEALVECRAARNKTLLFYRVK